MSEVSALGEYSRRHAYKASRKRGKKLVRKGLLGVTFAVAVLYVLSASAQDMPWKGQNAQPPAAGTAVAADPAAAATTAAAGPAQPAPTPPELLGRLAFDKDQVILDDRQRQELDKIATRLRANPALRIMIDSYASPREGQASDARRISVKRAVALRKYLITKGLVQERISVRALGDTVADEPKDRADVMTL